ncbi:BREX-2 system adenine-specific DNA-methyltransferase PglX [Sorangium sp. So ce590]|uniref:BREX-2 system adenine-specific DNA-methyltransferase PglX n=1 Tax=Sorangium sp. So ce590 TaxID=3133317 RepID=UPI003F62607E
MAARRQSTQKNPTEIEGQSDPKAPLDSARLLVAARPVLKQLAEDLLVRARGSAAVTAALEARHKVEQEQRRTADPFVVWQTNLVDQVAAAWLLSCVFVRTLEDRGLLGGARLAGPGAADSQRIFLDLAPSLGERDYLLTVFRELSHFPAARDLFDAKHNPVWLLTPSAEAAKALLGLFRLPDPEAPTFRFGQEDTRFLGDLYQDLNEVVQKRYALLQTPRFVESFILDRTLEPAIERFGLNETTVIDPTCGSGHFLLGAFDRLYEHRLHAEPGLGEREAARKALDAVYGADINPYAVAIARFRLTLAYLEKAGFKRLAGAPALPLHLVVADSLLHNAQAPQASFLEIEGQSAEAWAGQAYALEDEGAAREVLHRRFAAVVGNPPYIMVKDAVLRERYREMYDAAAGKYSLAAPFAQRFFQLARERGSVGMITANSFMKREFGKKLIEKYLPTVNLELIVNTSGAYIPGHGTPTVLLFGTGEAAQGTDILAVLAKRGEPTTPEDPEQGLVWRSIADNWSEVAFENDYMSVARVARLTLGKHPWSLGGGGAAELKELLEERAKARLGEITDNIGIASFTLEDDVYLRPRGAWLRLNVPETRLRAMVIGEVIRDWSIGEVDDAFFPYDDNLLPMRPSDPTLTALWPHRTNLSNNILFGGKTKIQSGIKWYEFGRLTADKLRTPRTITFAFVATHNHFVLDRGGKVFNRSAPIIKLPETATEDDHLALLAYLNSSTACFWMKQVFQPKNSAEHKTHPEPERNRYEHAGTALQELPVPPGIQSDKILADAARRLTDLATMRWAAIHDNNPAASTALPTSKWREFDDLREQMVVLQEEIDWRVYHLFGLATDAVLGEPPPAARCPRGDRPCERLVPRKSFVRRRDHLVPLHEAEVPPINRLSSALESLWACRLSELRASEDLTMLEQPLYKRQWRDTDDNLDEFAFRRNHDETRHAQWLLDSIECEMHDIAPVRPSEIGRRTKTKIEGAASQTLLESDAVAYMAALRHSPSGLDKRAIWEQTWDLQRREDAGEKVGEIPVPPKYDPKDYRDPVYYRLRGKLDVPKERFISYPGCESDQDGEPVYGWAGWNHLQQAQALAALYQKRKQEEAWGKDRLTPMLAGLLELLPWIKQWHNEPSEEFSGMRLGDFFDGFLDGECRSLGLTRDDLRAWRPEAKRRGKAAGKRKKPATEDAEESASDE